MYGRAYFQRTLYNYSDVYECRAFTDSHLVRTARHTLTILRQLKVETFQTWTGTNSAAT